MTLKREKFLNCLLVQTSFSTENSIFHRLTTLCVKRAFKCVYKTYTKILSLLPEAGEIIVTKAEGKFSARPSLNKDLQSYKVIGKNTLYHSLIQSYNSVYMLNINHLNRSSHCLQWSVVKFHLCLFPMTICTKLQLHSTGECAIWHWLEQLLFENSRAVWVEWIWICELFLCFKKVLTSEYNIRTKYNRSVKLRGKPTIIEKKHNIHFMYLPEQKLMPNKKAPLEKGEGEISTIQSQVLSRWVHKNLIQNCSLVQK